MSDHTGDVPSLHDLHSDANVRSSALPEETEFQPDPPPTDDDFDAMVAQAQRAAVEIPVTVIDRSHGAGMGLLLASDANGKLYLMSDIASCYAYVAPGDVGTIWRAFDGAWMFTKDEAASELARRKRALRLLDCANRLAITFHQRARKHPFESAQAKRWREAGHRAYTVSRRYEWALDAMVAALKATESPTKPAA